MLVQREGELEPSDYLGLMGLRWESERGRVTERDLLLRRLCYGADRSPHLRELILRRLRARSGGGAPASFSRKKMTQGRRLVTIIMTLSHNQNFTLPNSDLATEKFSMMVNKLIKRAGEAVQLEAVNLPEISKYGY